MTDHDRLRRHADELALHHVDHHADGPGLYSQLIDELGTPSGRGDGGGRRGRPGSRPPGWRADISELLTDIRHGVRDHLASIGRPPSRTATALAHRPPLSPVAFDLLLLPDLAVDWDVLGDDLARWVAHARLALGYSVPTKDLPQVVCCKRVYTRSGWREIGCGQASLRVLADASSPVWCGSATCHNSIDHAACIQAEDGSWGCRRSTRDTRHAIRWTCDEWLSLWARQQEQAS